MRVSSYMGILNRVSSLSDFGLLNVSSKYIIKLTWSNQIYWQLDYDTSFFSVLKVNASDLALHSYNTVRFEMDISY